MKIQLLMLVMLHATLLPAQKIESAKTNASAKTKVASQAATTAKPNAAAGKEIPFDPSQPVYDIDSNQYTVLSIGKQFWLKENLRTSKYNDTSVIPSSLSDDQWKQTKSGAYAIFENNPLHEKTYGKLYNGYAVATGKLCPRGWRVATDKDWKDLETTLGMPAAELERTGERGEVASKLKSTSLWQAAPFSIDNNSGFTAMPAGSRLDNGEYANLGQYANFWTSTVYDDRYGLLYLWNHHVNYNSNAIGRIYTLANNGYSCRCVLDEKTTAKKPVK